MSKQVASAPEESPRDLARAEFLKGMRAVPGAVAIIAVASEGKVTGMAATAWNSLCADPPMLLVCVNRKASAHPLIRTGGGFSVNLVPSHERELVATFSGQRGLDGSNRFVEGQWRTGGRGHPLLKGAAASFECECVAEHAHGTHSIFVGKVGEVHSDPRAEALLYIAGAFARAETLDAPAP
ncbi:MAG: flavin reductase family protein [Sphingobium sp.]